MNALRKRIVGYPCGRPGCWRRRHVRPSNREMLGYCRKHLEEMCGIGFDAKLDSIDRRYGLSAELRRRTGAGRPSLFPGCRLRT